MLSPSHLAHVADRLVLAAVTHWLEIRRGRPMPRRQDLDACAIPAVLPFLALYQYLPDEKTFLCRLAGDAIYGPFGPPARGRRLAEFMPSSATLEVPLRNAIEQPALVHAVGRFLFAGRWVAAETIMLPFADDGLTGDSVLHVVSKQVAPTHRNVLLAEIDLLTTTTPIFPDPTTGAIVSVERRITKAAG